MPTITLHNVKRRMRFEVADAPDLEYDSGLGTRRHGAVRAVVVEYFTAPGKEDRFTVAFEMDGGGNFPLTMLDEADRPQWALDLATEHAETGMRAPPRRGDAVEVWLKAERDEYAHGGLTWSALSNLLDTYRLHADTRTPLGEHACEHHCDCDEAAGISAGDVEVPRNPATDEEIAQLPVLDMGAFHRAQGSVTSGEQHGGHG